MTRKAKSTSTAVVRETQVLPRPTSAAWTIEERLHRIEAMGKRIDGYIAFICKVGTLNNTSAEAKERAVTAFYERMIIVEKQLARIQEEFRLG